MVYCSHYKQQQRQIQREYVCIFLYLGLRNKVINRYTVSILQHAASSNFHFWLLTPMAIHRKKQSARNRPRNVTLSTPSSTSYHFVVHNLVIVVLGTVPCSLCMSFWCLKVHPVHCACHSCVWKCTLFTVHAILVFESVPCSLCTSFWCLEVYLVHCACHSGVWKCTLFTVHRAFINYTMSKTTPWCGLNYGWGHITERHNGQGKSRA